MMFDFVFDFFSMVFVYIEAIIFYIIIVSIIINAIKRNNNHRYFKNNIVSSEKNINENSKKVIYKDVNKKELERFNINDINVLKDYYYDIFVRFEEAYNNLDYNVMRSLSTKELYQNYYTGISLDLKVGNKRIIKDIKRENVIIYEIDSTISKQVSICMIEISYKNYMVNKKGDTISGDSINEIKEKFQVTFRKEFNKQDIIKCPNCGASVIGSKCEYCRTLVKSEEFRISDIKRIIE